MRQQLEHLKKTDDRFSLLNSEDMLVIDSINNSLMLGAIEHLSREGFKWIDVPILTKITGACENVDTLYEVDHFNRTAYLSQTGQLYLEAKIPLHKKVWTIIQSSRAEGEVDGRHLNQFQLVEFEHEGDLSLLLGNIQSTIQAMVEKVLDNNQDSLDCVGRDIKQLKTYAKDFPRISYTEAIEKMKGTPLELEWGSDLKHTHEQFLVKEHGNRPLFITHYPTGIKFFNMRVNDDNPSVVNSADLILPYSGEAVGSAERENDYERLVKRLKASEMWRILRGRGTKLSEFSDYLNLIRKNPVLHSGCGIGFARVSQSVLGFDDIRMATSYPVNSESLY
jgi:asparaginyl-tRNA synthetase